MTNRRLTWTKTFLSALVAAPMLVTSIGCGGDSDFDIIDDGDTEVRDLNIQDERIRVGEGSVVSVDFDYDTFDVNRGDDVFVTVRLPAGTVFRNDSAEVDGTFDDDERVRPSITRCAATDETFLFFSLDEDDLGGSSSDINSDATLKLTVDALKVGTGLIAARASDDFELPDCDRVFEPQEARTLTVTQ